MAFFCGLLAGATLQAPPGRAMVLSQVVSTIRDSGGRYRWASASLLAADCSGLVSVAQSLAMGQLPHRLGDTSTIYAGKWPDVIPGAAPDDEFIIAASRSHMVAQVDGVGIEATTSGQPYKVGPDAHSVWDPAMRRWHVNPAVLTLA